MLRQVELQSGVLKRGYIHSEKFWSENARKFEFKNFQLIKELIGLLDTSIDNTTVAVACYDLGEFARYYEAGKVLLNCQIGQTKSILTECFCQISVVQVSCPHCTDHGCSIRLL